MRRPSISLSVRFVTLGRLVLLFGVALLAALAPTPSRAWDKDGFPTDRWELNDWFPADETDADWSSDPEAPGPIQGKSTPPSLQDQADKGRTGEKPVDTRTLEERRESLQTRYEAMLKEVKKALEKPVDPVLPPPDYELECNDDPVIATTTEQLVQAYVKRAADPEIDLLKRLLSIRRQFQLLGFKMFETHQKELAARLMVKGRELISKYGKDRNKVLAILAFLHKAQEIAALVGADVPQSVYAETTAWLQGLMPDLLRDIRQKHDYRAVSAVMALAQVIINAGAGSPGIDPEAILREIEAALTFELKLELYVLSTGANGSKEDWQLESTIPMKTRVSQGKSVLVPEIVIEGDGNGRYASYRDYDTHPITMTAPGFEVLARVMEFNACTGTAKLFFDRFYADEETYDLHTGSAPIELPMIHSLFHGILDLQVVGDGFQFDVPVQNLSPQAVDTVIQQSMGVFDTKLTVKLTHQPK